MVEHPTFTYSPLEKDKKKNKQVDTLKYLDLSNKIDELNQIKNIFPERSHVVSVSLNDHIKVCKARKSRCIKCKKLRHFQRTCRGKTVNGIEEKEINMRNIDMEQEFDVIIFEI